MRADYIFAFIGLFFLCIGIIFTFKKTKYFNKIEVIWACSLLVWEEFSWGAAVYYKESLLPSIFWAIASFLFWIMIFFIVIRPKHKYRIAFIIPCLLGTIYYLALFSMVYVKPQI